MSRIPRKRTILVLLVAAATLIFVVAFRDELDTVSTTGRLTGDSAPALDTMRKAAAETPTPDAFIMNLWRTGLMPQQRFAVALVNDRAGVIAGGWETLRPILLSASASHDAQLTRDALGALGRFGDRTAQAWAGEGLADADPVIARAWIDYLSAIEAVEWAPTLAKIVDAPNGELAARATAALADWTGQPWTLSPDAPSATRERVAEEVSVWLAEHPDKFASPPRGAAPARTEPLAIPLVADDTLGRPTEIGPGESGPTLLHFFSVRSKTHEADIAMIEALTADGSAPLRVIHICIDRTEPIYTYVAGQRPTTELIDAELPAGVSIGVPDLGEPMERGSIEPVLLATMNRLRVTGPVVVDADGQITRAYAAQVVPSFQWIDSQGRVVRRFEGSRPLSVARQMLTELSPDYTAPGPAPKLPADRIDLPE